MTKRVLQISLAVLLPLIFAAAKSAEEPLDALKSRAESARPQDQAPLFARISRREVDEADRYYTAGDVDKAKNEVNEVARYAERAAESAEQSGKHQKQVEILLREIARKLDDVRKSLNLEDRPDAETAVKRVEKSRERLLDHMFGLKSKEEK